MDELRPPPEPGVTYIQADAAGADRVREALLLAEPGAVLDLGAGRYVFSEPLLLDVGGVTLRGDGAGKTVLDFSGMVDAEAAVQVLADNLVLAGLSVRDSPGDAVAASGRTELSLIDIAIDWPGARALPSDVDGVAVSRGQRVLMDRVSVAGASATGLAIDQSEQVLLRGVSVRDSSIGVFLQNCSYAELSDSDIVGNGLGVGVVGVPGLEKKVTHDITLSGNRIAANNRVDGAFGADLSGAPRGTGVLVMAGSAVAISGNEVGDHQTANVLILGYVSAFDDPGFNPFAKGVGVHSNVFGRSGWQPEDSAIGSILVRELGTPVPDIVWDGRAPLVHMVLGAPEGEGLYIDDNERADGGMDRVSYANLNTFWRMTVPWLASPSRNVEAVRGALPSAVSSVTLPSDQLAHLQDWK